MGVDHRRPHVGVAQQVLHGANTIAGFKRLVKQKGWTITGEFVDEGVSGGSTRNRKAFELMSHLARQKPRQADR